MTRQALLASLMELSFDAYVAGETDIEEGIDKLLERLAPEAFEAMCRQEASDAYFEGQLDAARSAECD